jgi:hypothetical protein
MGTGRSTSDGTLTDCREMIDLTRSPFILIWRVIGACAHCQAEAIPRRNPGELRFAEGCNLIGDTAAFGPSRQTSCSDSSRLYEPYAGREDPP